MVCDGFVMVRGAIAIRSSYSPSRSPPRPGAAVCLPDRDVGVPDLAITIWSGYLPSRFVMVCDGFVMVRGALGFSLMEQLFAFQIVGHGL